MNKIKYSECGPPIEQSDIAGFEAHISKSLPADYVAFLLEYNGCQPVPNGFNVLEHEAKSFRLRELFGLNRSYEDENLKWNYDSYINTFPENIIPIGATETSDLLCMDVDSEEGNVFFWDAIYESEELVYDTYMGFKMFMESLHELND